MTAIGGFRSDLSITRKTDRHVGNVSAGVLFPTVVIMARCRFTLCCFPSYLRANVLFSFYYTDMLMKVFLTIFPRFPTTFRRFSQILHNCFESRANVPEHFPKISEDCRTLSRKTRRCYDHTPTNVSTI